jgi:hypothetical protein
MALGLKTGPRAEKCYFTPANSVLKFNFTPAYAKISLFFSNTILFLFVIDTHCEKQLISPLGFVKFFRTPHC